MGRKLKRDYLNLEETNFYMLTKAFIQTIQGERSMQGKPLGDLWEDWKSRGMITPTMQRNIKTALTNLKKFCYELEENLSEAENKKLEKKLMKFDYRLIDDPTLRKIHRDMTDFMQYAVMERNLFDPILEDIVAVRCVGCTCNYEKCPLYKLLDDIEQPRVGEESNCPYAVNLSEYSDKDLKEIEKMKQTIKERRSIPKEFNREVEYEEKSIKPVKTVKTIKHKPSKRKRKK